MSMSKEDYAAIDNALLQYTAIKKITEKCPHCGSPLKIVQESSCYEVKCQNNCISETFRGV